MTVHFDKGVAVVAAVICSLCRPGLLGGWRCACICPAPEFVESGRGEPDDRSEPRPDSTTTHNADPSALHDERD